MSRLACICFAEALSAPEVAWSLVDAGFEVVALARRGRRAALRHSRHVRVVEVTPPESDFEATLAEFDGWLASWKAEDGERVVLPLDDAAVWLCGKVSQGAGWTWVGPRGLDVELALDKWLQIETARSAGLNPPDTIVAQTPDDVLSKGHVLPLMLKPAHAVIARGGRLQQGRRWICSNERELERAVADWKAAYPLLIQPFIRGVGEGVFGLATKDGVRAWSGHRRLRMMNPHGSGSSACVSQAVSVTLRSKVEDFITQAGWRGLFMVELLRDREGTEWFVEFNGRPWGSMALSRRRGLEYPAWSVLLALDPQSGVSLPPPSDEPIVCRSLGRECVHLLFVLRGPNSRGIDEWPRFWQTLRDVLALHRRDTFYNWRRDDKRVFLSDCWYTIRDQLSRARN